MLRSEERPQTVSALPKEIAKARPGSDAIQSKFSQPQDPGGLGIALLLLSLVALCSFLSWQQYVRYADRTRHSNEALAVLNDLVSAVQLAESSQRGFLLTWDPMYRNGYQSAVVEANKALEAEELLPEDVRNPRLGSELQTAVRAKLAELETTTAAFRPGRSSDEARKARINSGFYTMLKIRSVQRQYVNELQRAVRSFRDDSRFYARSSQWVSLLGSVGIFAIVFFGNRRIVRLISTTANLNNELTHVNNELQQFVYSASHDLREPLRTLVIYSQLVDKKTKQGLPIAADVGHIGSAARLMTQIVEDLMTYTQMGSDVISGNERADLRVVLAAVKELLVASIRDTHAEITHGELPVLPLAEVHARILLQNLIGNALKYRNPREAPKIHVAVEHTKGTWELSVSDNGIGIKPEYQEQIFGLFKRLHSRSEYPGTGLGLAICKKIVERYKGALTVESQVGAGSTFRVTIPEPGLAAHS